MAKRKPSFDKQRKQMVKEQLAARNITDQRVLDAMGAVPRHKFVSKRDQHLAYADGPLGIGEAQTISQPYVVALMIQLLSLKESEKALEIGTGSGYQAAIMAHIAQEVHSIERHASLANNARQVLDELKLTNVHVHHADGSLGWPQDAPYDAIIVAAASPNAPDALLEQLTDEGVLVLPVGDVRGQRLQRWRRVGNKFEQEDLVRVSFVPLLGEQGWDSESWPGF